MPASYQLTVKGLMSVPILVSLLYGLAVLAVGVTGSFLPINLFHDCDYNPDQRKEGTWRVNATALPENSIQWASRKIDPHAATADFMYLPASGFTYFSGRSSSEDGWQMLWFTDGSQPPRQRLPAYLQPTGFTLISDDAVCFLADRHPGRSTYQTVLSCVDKGDKFQDLTVNNKNTETVDSRSFHVFDSKLFYKARTFPEAGYKVYSVNPYNSMEQELYSYYVPPEDSSDNDHGGDCREDLVIRNRALMGLFVSALPITLASIKLWTEKSTPSASVTTFVGISLIYLCLLWTINPSLSSDLPIQIWFSTAGVIFVIVLSRQLLVDIPRDSLRAGPDVWGTNVGGICFFASTFSLVMSRESGDGIVGWILLTVFCFARSCSSA